MLKKWKKFFLVAAVLGWAAGSALAQKLTFGATEPKPIPDFLTQQPTMEPTPGAGFPAIAGPMTMEPKSFAGSMEGPILTTGSMEQLPMPQTMPGTPVEEGPVYFGGEEVIGNGEQLGFFGEVGLHILRPVVGNNQALIASTTTAAAALAAVSTTSFSWDFSASPSITLGYTTPTGLSGAISWFRFDQFSNPRNVSEQPLDAKGAGATFSSVSGFLSDNTIGGPAAGQTNDFNLETYLVLDIWDLDVTQSFTLGRFEGSIGGGLRYLHMAQRFAGLVNQTGLAPGAINAAFESSANSFSGIGPTIVGDLQRPLGSFNLSLYANARAGLLFGSRHEDDFNATASNPGGGAATVIAPGSPVANRTDQTVGFGEIELGIEWAGQFGRFYPVARLGFEAREYLNTGNSQSIVLTHTSDVGFYGFAIRAGTSY